MLDAAAVRIATTTASDEASAALFVAATALNEAKAKEAAATRRRDAAKKELAIEKDRLSDLTVRAYVTGGEVSIDQYSALVDGDTTDPAAGRKVLFEQALQRQQQVTDQATEDLAAARKALKIAKQELAAAQAENDARAKVAADRAADRAPRRVGPRDGDRRPRPSPCPPRRRPVAGWSSEGASLIGLPRLNAEDLAGWFRSTSYSPRVSTPIEDYAKWFIREGKAEGIRGDIAFAQAVLETGGFANTDSRGRQQLLGHRPLRPVPVWLALPDAARWACEPRSSCSSPTPCASPSTPTRWWTSACAARPAAARPGATSPPSGPPIPTYAPKVMLIYTGIVDHALSRRHAGQGFDDPPNEPDHRTGPLTRRR